MKRIISILAFATGAALIGGFQVRAESIASVLREPESYHHKRVQLVGIVRGDRVPIELYANLAGAVRMESSQAIRVVLPDHWREHGPYDLRRVRVSGIVDANQHGTWGRNPCSLSLETMEILSGPVAPWPDVAVVFRNETATPVSLILKAADVSHSFELLPREYEWEYVKNDGIVSVTSRAGVLIAKARITMHPSTPYYDSVNAASYYRITDGKIEKVLPKVAKNWGWRR